MKRKIFFITRNLAGGGAERVISNLANHFSNLDYEVTLVCLDQGEKKYNIDPAVTVRSLVNRKYKENIFTRLYYALVTFLKLMRIINKEQPYCCISFMTSVNVWTGFCCLLSNKDYIVSERNSPFETIEKLSKLSKWITYHIYRKAKAVVLPSKKMVNTYNDLPHFKNLKNLVTIFNPVHVFSGSLGSAVYPKDFILSVGRLNKHKGFDVLIEAFYQLKDYDVDLLISGVGPYQQILENKVQELGLSSRVKFIGFRKNIHDYYTQASLFVSASRFEGYPNVLVEAMSLGCPTVATDCNFGPSEIIENGVNGFLVQVDNRDALANAMEALLKDEELRAKYSKIGKRINETNSIENIAEKWNNLIVS